MKCSPLMFSRVSLFTLCIAVACPLSVSAQDGLVLWNRLGDAQQVQNSEIGPGFELHEENGDVLFEDGVFGGALATTGGTASTGPAGGYLLISPDEFFPADKTRGTVELWIQKQIPRLIPFETPLLTLFGRIR